MVRVSRRLVSILVTLAVAAGGGLRAEEVRLARCPGPAIRDAIRNARPDGEVELASGRRIKLVDLRPAESRAGPATGAETWLASLVGESATVREAGFPDRWGRVPAQLSVGSTHPVDVAELLVGEGWAIVHAGERDRLCRPDLLGLEATARAKRAGLWATAPWPLAAENRDAVAAETGRFAIVEGRVVSVGERRDRTYLNFGRDWARDFSVTIPKRSWDSLKAAGFTAAGLTRSRVRVRGTVEVRRAPTMDVVAPDMLEILEAGPGRPRATGEQR